MALEIEFGNFDSLNRHLWKKIFFRVNGAVAGRIVKSEAVSSTGMN